MHTYILYTLHTHTHTDNKEPESESNGASAVYSSVLERRIIKPRNFRAVPITLYKSGRLNLHEGREDDALGALEEKKKGDGKRRRAPRAGYTTCLSMCLSALSGLMSCSFCGESTFRVYL